MNSKKTLAGGLVLALVACGMVLASNMGFKLALPQRQGGTPQSASGLSAVSLPYVRKAGIDTARDLIQDIEAAAGGDVVQQIQAFDRSLDSFFVYTGAVMQPTNFPLESGQGLFVKVGADFEYVVKGSHDPALTLDLRATASGVSRTGFNFHAPPYHGIADNALDLIGDLGGIYMPVDDTGFVQQVQAFNPTGDYYEVYTAVKQPTNFEVKPGRAYFIKLQKDVLYMPSHF